jgi:hypothetical protein
LSREYFIIFEYLNWGLTDVLGRSIFHSVRRKPRPLFTVVIDTREQNPYRFGAPHKNELDDGGVIVSGLEEGDYGCLLEGELLPVRIERKSLSDLYGVVGNGRGRFAGDRKDGMYRDSEESGVWKPCELERLRKFKAYLLIEATADQVRAGYERSQIPGAAAWGSVVSWSLTYNIAPIFAGSWRTGCAACAGILEEFAVQWIDGRVNG